MPIALITGGSNFGNMIGNGGVAAAFDSVTNQGSGASASLAGTSGYVGKTLAAAKRVGKVVVYGSNNQGFVSSINPSVTLNIRAKTGAAPTSATDGTLIGTVTFTDTADESSGRAIFSTDSLTQWEHVLVQLVNNGGGPGIFIAEFEIYQFLPVASYGGSIG